MGSSIQAYIESHPHTSIVGGISYAEFDQSFFPLHHDDMVRMNEPAVASNLRRWRFKMEADCENWFNSEISNILLAAWSKYLIILRTSHNKLLTEENISENVDVTYSTRIGNQRVPLAIGEVKRGLNDPRAWQAGDISSKGSQRRLS